MGRALLCVLLLLITGVAVAVVVAAEVGAPPMVYVGAPPPIGVGALPQAKGETVGPFGVFSSGDQFNDGAFDGVRNVTVYIDNNGVTGIKIQYVAKDKFQIREHGSNHNPEEFVVAYPEEFITSINGRQIYDSTLEATFVSSLLFVTSYRRVSPLFGKLSQTGTNFVLEPKGGVDKLAGFLGRSGERIYALGAHFSPTSCISKRVYPKSEVVPPLPYGANGGFSFDDGAFEGVRRVTVRVNRTNMAYIRIQYVENDKFQIREHGSYTNENDQEEAELEVEYPQEYITSIIISCTNSTVLTVTGFELVTSYARSQVLGMSDSDIKYVVEPKGGRGAKLVGFLGRSRDSINAVGAHFYLEEVSSATKTESCLFCIYVLWVLYSIMVY